MFAAVGLVGAFAVAVDWLQVLETWFWDESSCAIGSPEAVDRPEYGDTELQVSERGSGTGFIVIWHVVKSWKSGNPGCRVLEGLLPFLLRMGSCANARSSMLPRALDAQQMFHADGTKP